MRYLLPVLLLLAVACGVLGEVYSQVHVASTPPGFALDPKIDYRDCGPPRRDASGSIIRSQSVVTAYKKLWPCPSTGLSVGACPGWALDHSRPLALNGCDAVFNMNWMPVDTPKRRGIKSCALSTGVLCKDRYERL